MNLRIAAAASITICGVMSGGSAWASEPRLSPPPANKYQITAEEQSACGTDAATFCSAVYPDEDKMLACMKLNRSSLSAACRPVFDMGMRRRHLN
ncbi:cysteine rich repeat-containing protein [Lichenifustis flavocetrariae]|uniref:Cysteine rich repeat-containing protein n=1 Tax=Lichenifustis flavocetrariae TaxID=2949735 RepID=A0AA41YRF9_9HYPH|nr:cysteine rich repeat-containing protein [Lichenifustis flavocetrariae]MCW6507199.1 cysteine rich repeat-containing protein [Lichenifustis flavocetrariae]